MQLEFAPADADVVFGRGSGHDCCGHLQIEHGGYVDVDDGLLTKFELRRRVLPVVNAYGSLKPVVAATEVTLPSPRNWKITLALT